MRPNHVKRKVQGGGASIGKFMFEFSTAGIGQLAATAGAEFAIYDMEHSGWSIETIRMPCEPNYDKKNAMREQRKKPRDDLPIVAGLVEQNPATPTLALLALPSALKA